MLLVTWSLVPPAPTSALPCRVLVVLAEGNLNPARAGGDELYSFFRRAAEWDRLLRPRQTFSVKARVHSCTDVPSAMLVQVGANYVRQPALEGVTTTTLLSSQHPFKSTEFSPFLTCSGFRQPVLCKAAQADLSQVQLDAHIIHEGICHPKYAG